MMFMQSSLKFGSYDTYIYITYIRIITVSWSEAGSYLADLITGVLIGAPSLPVTPTTEH